MTFQLTNLHGDVAATAEASPAATELKATFRYDEFGNPNAGSAGRFGWLGGKGRRSELSSGVIQMGARSYVPEIGRFISVDAVRGGSASAYDYANADPVNGFDLEGEAPCNPHGLKTNHYRGLPGRYNIEVHGTVSCKRRGPRKVKVRAVIVGGIYETQAEPGRVQAINLRIDKGPLSECGDARPKMNCPVEAMTTFSADPPCSSQEVWFAELKVNFYLSWETPSGRQRKETIPSYVGFTFGLECG